jgi:hypothetical protein
MQQHASLPGPYSSSEIADMVANNGLVAMWDTAVLSSIALNGNNVSGIVDLTGLGTDLSQGTAANQPLYTGAPSYGPTNWPSIRFTRANAHRLFKTNTNLLPAGLFTIFQVLKFNSLPGGMITFCNATSAYVSATLGTQDSVNNLNIIASALRATTTLIDTNLHIQTATLPSATAATQIITLDGVAQSMTGSASVVNPGATASVVVGNDNAAGRFADMDWLFTGVFNAGLSAPFAAGVTNRLKARLGMA